MHQSLEECLDTAHAWLAECDELLITSLYGAGDRDYQFCHSLDDIKAFCQATGGGYPSVLVCLYRGERLPLRGPVDESFLRDALRLAPDSTEGLVVCLTPSRPNLLSGNRWDNHAELNAELRSCLGETAACGPLPDWDPSDRRDPNERGWIAWSYDRA